MKTFPIKALALSGFAAATCIMHSSCVAPYAEVGVQGPPQTVATYRTGYETRTLPSGYRTEVINDTSYYNHNGTYYRPRSGGYVVVEAPRRHDGPSARHSGHLTRLPAGYRTVEHRGARYYQVNDVYYQQQGQSYVVVRSPY